MKEEKKKVATRTPRVRTTKKTTEVKEETKTKRIIKKRPTKKVEKAEKSIIKKSVNFSLIEVIIIVLITGLVVSVASGLIVYNNYDKITTASFTPKGEFDEFYENYNKIIDRYVEDVDKEKLIDAAIAGMYDYLGDEYSTYLDEEDTSDLSEQLQGEYTGVGIEITTLYDDNSKPYIKINKVFKDSPAEEAGLKAGDIITKVDGVKMIDSNQVATTIKNGKKESYEITFIRNGKEKTLTLTRKRVYINSVTSEEHGSVGYIKMDTFSATAKEQMENVLDGFSNNIKSVVIDLRDNTGGYLDTAYDVANLFLPKGKVVYQLKDRKGNITSYKADAGVYRKFNKIVVIINESSASASEILALALRESADAKIVGVKSYGKGTVQETDNLKSGSMIKFTTSYWLSPNGNSINKVGIKPDIKVEDIKKQKTEAIKAAK